MSKSFMRNTQCKLHGSACATPLGCWQQLGGTYREWTAYIGLNSREDGAALVPIA